MCRQGERVHDVSSAAGRYRPLPPALPLGMHAALTRPPTQRTPPPAFPRTRQNSSTDSWVQGYWQSGCATTSAQPATYKEEYTDWQASSPAAAAVKWRCRGGLVVGGKGLAGVELRALEGGLQGTTAVSLLALHPRRRRHQLQMYSPAPPLAPRRPHRARHPGRHHQQREQAQAADAQLHGVQLVHLRQRAPGRQLPQQPRQSVGARGATSVASKLPPGLDAHQSTATPATSLIRLVCGGPPCRACRTGCWRR